MTEPLDRLRAALDDATPRMDGMRSGVQEPHVVVHRDDLVYVLDRLALAEAVVEAARLIAQWHDAIGSGPIAVLNAELGDLGRLVAAYEGSPSE
jgi:hypothetical protein